LTGGKMHSPSNKIEGHIHSEHLLRREVLTHLALKSETALVGHERGEIRALGDVASNVSTQAYCTVTATGLDGIPFATTTSELAPLSIFAGTSKWVETILLPVATPMVL
jgi:hypothetical protein